VREQGTGNREQRIGSLSLLTKLKFVPHESKNRYKIDENYRSVRIEAEFYPRGNPLLNLSAAQKEILQTEYQKAVDRSIWERGLWQEVTSLYVKARK
jgi:hypothetical protein